jgi:hypothetical protein
MDVEKHAARNAALCMPASEQSAVQLAAAAAAAAAAMKNVVTSAGVSSTRTTTPPSTTPPSTTPLRRSASSTVDLADLTSVDPLLLLRGRSSSLPNIPSGVTSDAPRPSRRPRRASKRAVRASRSSSPRRWKLCCRACDTPPVERLAGYPAQRLGQWWHHLGQLRWYT